MAFKIFGFQIGKKEVPSEPRESQSPIVPVNDDGSITIQAGGVYGSYLDLEGTAKNEVELITKYREMSMTPEAEQAIDEIINEAIVMEDNKAPVSVITDDIPYNDEFKDTIQKEFDYIIKLLDFNNIGYEIFRRWYIDGRLFFHIIIDDQNPKEGIKELRFIDPRKIRKVREVRKIINNLGVEVVQDIQEYYVFNDRGLNNISNNTAGVGARISKDSIVYVHSGLIDATTNAIVSYLHKAIKPLNQLRMIEDAIVIYRLSRAPERRVFYIDVGNLPKNKAEAYMKEQMAAYRNKMVYDVTTGDLRDDKRHLSMMEDFWLPRREGGKGTEIDVLKGGENLGQLEDVNYFQEKLYRSLGVPLSRLKSEGGFSLGRSAEISRDELKFFKFVARLRKRFTMLFDTILSQQLLLKGVISREDWEEIKENLYYDFAKDSHFTELKDSEIMMGRIQLFIQMQEFIGRQYSMEWARKNILKQTEKEIEEQDKQISKEGLPVLPAGITLGMPVGMPGSDFAPPEYDSQQAEYDRMALMVSPAQQFQAQQQRQQQAARNGPPKKKEAPKQKKSEKSK